MSSSAGGGRRVAGSQPMITAVQCALGAQINFGDLTPYLTRGLVYPTAYVYHSVLQLKGQEHKVSPIPGEAGRGKVLIS